MKTAIIYCRVSTTKQRDNGESLDNQEIACRKYCENNNIQVLGVFKEAFTGKTKERITLIEAMNNAEINNASYFIVFDIDRFSREGFRAYSELKNKLASYGTELRDSKNIIGDTTLVVENDIVDMSKYAWNKESSSEYAEVIMTTQAQIEGKKIIQRTITREIQLEQQGYQVRASNFGYMNEKVKEGGARVTIQVPHPKEGEWVKEIFKLRCEGYMTDKEIAEALNLKGCITRKGRPMTAKYIQSLVKNPIYAGIIKTIWTGDKPIRAKYKGLVSIEEWNKANKGKIKIVEIDKETVVMEFKNKNEVIEINTPTREKRVDYNPDYPFSKVLKCPICGGTLTSTTGKSKSGKIYYYYNCKGKKGVKHEAYNLSRDEVNEHITNVISRLKPSPEILELMDIIAGEVYEERKTELEAGKKDYKKEYKKLEREEKEISDSLMKFIELPNMLSIQEKKLEEIKRKKGELEIAINSGEDMGSLEEFKYYQKKLTQHLDKLVQQRDNPEMIQLVFAMVFGGRIVYENIGNPTPRLPSLHALESQIKNSQNGNLDGNTCWQAHEDLNPERGIWSPAF